MKCAYSLCNGPITLNKMKRCKVCQSIFCSYSCLSTHTSMSHKTQEDKKCLIDGIFEKKIPSFILPQYQFQNMEFQMNPKTGQKRIVGKGAYGEIYLAKDKIENNYYAIKTINKEKLKDSAVSVEIIKREVTIHIRITHPNIVKLYSSYEDRENIYMIMEFVTNGNLFTQIQKYGGLNEKKCFKYFIQVAIAIYFLHKNGYSHRDIKPENILLTDDEICKLCDFGWCIDISSGERTTFCGTIEYMSPEIVNDKTYDYCADMWSLGVLLYEMLHGHSPFIVNNDKTEKNEKIKEVFKNINSLNYTIEKNISPECKDLIEKLLCVDVKQRMKIDEVFQHPWVKKYESEFGNLYLCEKRLTKSQIIKKNIMDDDEYKIDESLFDDNNTNNKKEADIIKTNNRINRNKEINKVNNNNIKNKGNNKPTNYNIKNKEFKSIKQNVNEYNSLDLPLLKERKKIGEKKDDDMFDNLLNDLTLKNQVKKKKKKHKPEEEIKQNEVKKQDNNFDENLNAYNNNESNKNIKEDNLLNNIYSNNHNNKVKENFKKVNISKNKEKNNYTSNDCNLNSNLNIDELINDINNTDKEKNKINEKFENKRKMNNTEIIHINTTQDLIDECEKFDKEEFAFLNNIGDTPDGKYKFDNSKMLNMNFLPVDLLYNQSNYKDSSQELLKTIDMVEKAQELQEQKDRIKKMKKTTPGDETKEEGNEKESFWSKFFRAFQCGQCTRANDV